MKELLVFNNNIPKHITERINDNEGEILNDGNVVVGVLVLLYDWGGRVVCSVVGLEVKDKAKSHGKQKEGPRLDTPECVSITQTGFTCHLHK